MSSSDTTNTSADWARTGRPVVRGTQGIVAAGHYLTAMSAMRMLLSGGNAFDAAAAAGFAAAVVEPTAHYSLATEGVFMTYHAQSGQVRALSGQGVAPGKATVDTFAQRGLDAVPTGPQGSLSFTVPGVVDAFILLLESYGTKTLGKVIAPAIGYARHGFPMYPFMREKLGFPSVLEQFRRFPRGGMEVFHPRGAPPEVGQLLVQKELAATLGRLARAEAEASGDRRAGLQAAHDVFYRGELARTIVECSESVGGLLSMEDLADYRARYEEPVSTTFMGREVCTQSAWTQGAVMLQALSMLEGTDLRAMGHNSPRYIHTVAEALKLAFADRESYYGDPDFVKVPLDGLLSKEYAASRARLIRGDVAWPEMPEAGDPWAYAGGSGLAPSGRAQTAATPSASVGAGEPKKEGTTHFAVIDRDGNVVCVTPSGGRFDKSVYFKELGCTLSTRSEVFAVDAQHPNGIQPGKRPRTTLVNYMVCEGGRPVMTLGCPGGDDQAQVDLQLALNVLVFGMDPQQAVEAPRFATQSMPNSFYPHVYKPGELDVEPGIPLEVRSRLSEMGHVIVGTDVCGYGAIVTRLDPETGAMAAGADPRAETYAIGW